MKIVAVDTALRCSGFAVLEYNERGMPKLINCGFIKTPAKKKVSECLRRLSGGVTELISNHAPDVIAIEGTFFNKFARSAMLLGMARGAVVSVASMHDLPVYEYAPKTAKKAVTGSGSSSKEQVAFMMANIFKIRIDDIPLDATDAISIGMCHYQHSKLPEAIKKENLL